MAHTQWLDGMAAPTTVVEIPQEEPAELSPREITELLVRPADGDDDGAQRPRANPAFGEALFVELIRARQYHRAYEQLSSGCQARWGDPERFAQAQRESGASQVQSVSVRKVRHLPHWTDPESGTRHACCAELEVDYTVGRRDRHLVIQRTVHLVGEGGRWRSLCYPPEPEAGP